jgi:hypothetical protein
LSQQAVDRDRQRLVKVTARSGTASGKGCSIEACATTWSDQPAPRPYVKPSIRPGVVVFDARL